jgi:predicted N-acetyltransferase YhbS
MVQVRLAVQEDLATLREIERASELQYRDYGLDNIAGDEPASVEVLARYADHGRSWVAVEDSCEPIGYILVDVIDRAGHIELVSVTPAHQGQGVGGR